MCKAGPAGRWDPPTSKAPGMTTSLPLNKFKAAERKEPNQTYSGQKKHSHSCQKVPQLIVGSELVSRRGEGRIVVRRGGCLR